jgi:hypothetical protein
MLNRAIEIRPYPCESSIRWALIPAASIRKTNTTDSVFANGVFESLDETLLALLGQIR